MKILIFSRGYPSEGKPLEGSFEATQARSLQRAGHQVIIAYVRIRSFYRLRQRGFHSWEEAGITVCEFSELFPIIPNLQNIPFTPLYAPVFVSDKIYERALRKLYVKIIDSFGTPDIVHSHYLFISGFLGFIKAKYHIPLICTEHWSEVAQKTINKRIKKLGKIYRQADAVISVSNALAKRLSYHFEIKSTVIPNLLDYMYLNNDKACVFKKENFSFITIGRLNKIKCFDLLIYAFSEAQLPSDVTLSIIGDGEEYEHLSKIVTTLGMEHRIHFLKQKTMDEINALFAEYHVFVSSSRSETFGVVHIEAMAKGLPVLSTRSGGPEDFITEAVGLLIKPDCIQSLAEGLENIYTKYSNYNLEAIRNYCISSFSPEVVRTQILDKYTEVLQKYK